MLIMAQATKTKIKGKSFLSYAHPRENLVINKNLYCVKM